jgi:hypothetical protein
LGIPSPAALKTFRLKGLCGRLFYAMIYTQEIVPNGQATFRTLKGELLNGSH